MANSRHFDVPQRAATPAHRTASQRIPCSKDRRDLSGAWPALSAFVTVRVELTRSTIACVFLSSGVVGDAQTHFNISPVSRFSSSRGVQGLTRVLVAKRATQSQTTNESGSGRRERWHCVASGASSATKEGKAEPRWRAERAQLRESESWAP